MNTLQNTQEETGDADDVPDFARRNPLEVGVQLRNLVNRGDFLTVQYRGGQIVTRLLDVDTRERTFVFDWGAVAAQNAAMLETDQCEFHASPEGVRVEFATHAPRRGEFEGRPAFIASFPEVLYYVQRREYFRVDTPMLDPCMCRGTLPDGSPFAFEIHDISLGGVGLRTADERAGGIDAQTPLPGVELELRGHGKISVDLSLVGVRFMDMPNGTRRYHLGFRFDALPGSTENSLQRYITQIEMKRRALSRA